MDLLGSYLCAKDHITMLDADIFLLTFLGVTLEEPFLWKLMAFLGVFSSAERNSWFYYDCTVYILYKFILVKK